MRVLHEIALSQPLVDRSAWIDAATGIARDYAVHPGCAGIAAGLLYLAQAIAEVQKDAIEMKGLTQLLFEPETLPYLEKNVDLVATLLSARGLVPDEAKEAAREIVREVVEELRKKLETETRTAIYGAVRRNTESPLKVARNLDWKKTIRRNLDTWDAERRRLVPRRFHFWANQRKRHEWNVSILVDQSGSMAVSAVYSAVMAAIFASLDVLKTNLAFFNHEEIVDMTPMLVDPDFVVRESRFVDLNTGDHYSEKQILPAFLAKRTDPKKSWGGQLLQGASGSLYPSFSPRRLDLEAPGSVTALTQSALARLIERAVPSVSSALAALQERRKDVFAPETLPLVLRADTVLAAGARLQVVDEASAALFLLDEGDAADALADALRGCRLAAPIGDVALDGALPTLFPIAAVTVDAKGQLALAPLGRLDASAILKNKKARTQALAAEQKRGARWVDVARTS